MTTHYTQDLAAPLSQVLQTKVGTAPLTDYIYGFNRLASLRCASLCAPAVDGLLVEEADHCAERGGDVTQRRQRRRYAAALQCRDVARRFLDPRRQFGLSQSQLAPPRANQRAEVVGGRVQISYRSPQHRNHNEAVFATMPPQGSHGA